MAGDVHIPIYTGAFFLEKCKTYANEVTGSEKHRFG